MANIRKCPICGKEFARKNGRQIYCNAECLKAARREAARENPIKQLVCAYCGKEFSSKQRKKYCCEQCRKRAYSKAKHSRFKRTKPKMSLSEVAKACRAEGLSYGQYVAKYGG